MNYIYNTRFNPTVSGPLHAGHLYMALVNEVEAHSAGGKFIVRIDDTQGIWRHRLGKNLSEQYCADYQEQLNRFMKIDVWHRQSQLPRPEEIIGVSEFLKSLPKPQWFGGTTQVEWKKESDQKSWQYSPYLTAEKVIWDFWESVNLLIRGDDLITEANLYDYFVEEIGLPRIQQVYISRLMSEDRKNTVSEVDILRHGISKTFGAYKLETQINEFGVEKTLKLLKKSCLIDPDGEFLVENIKSNPVITGLKE